jgi:hypothetical protein
MQGPKLYISIAILLIIGLHALPVLQELRGHRQTFWPIMAWGMYRRAHDPKQPIQASRHRIMATTAGGSAVEIGPAEAGLGYFAFHRFYLGAMSTGDADAARRLADRLSPHRQDPIIELRVESETYRLSGSGLVKGHDVVATYPVGSRGL